jgi:hypothetical protein
MSSGGRISAFFFALSVTTSSKFWVRSYRAEFSHSLGHFPPPSFVAGGDRCSPEKPVAVAVLARSTQLCRKARGSIRRPRISFQISIIRNEHVCVAGRPLLLAVQLRPGEPLLVAVQLRPGESGRRRSGAKSDNDKKLFE